jgi:glycerol-3-phosphate dehydrogenase
VIDQSTFPLKQSIYFDTPDGRMVFAIPREGKTYVGTTDTFYNQDKLQPFITKSDRDYLIKAIHYMFPEVAINENDIESSWAGLRPLIYEEGKAASEISRKDEIWESKTGLLTIAGGKLTGYRKMAEAIVDRLSVSLEKEQRTSYQNCITKKLPISGGHVGGSHNYPAFTIQKTAKGIENGLTSLESEQLALKYGSNVDVVYDLLKENKSEALEYGIPNQLFAKLVYSIQCEMVATPIDFFTRRIGAVLFNIQSVHSYKQQVIDYMAEKLKWTDTTKELYTEELEKALKIASSTVN